jgi:hypothetical protein
MEDVFSTPFPDAFMEGDYAVGFVPKPVNELDIIKLSSCIRDKLDWENKMKDPNIVAKWKDEVAAIQPSITQSEDKLDYVLSQLEWVVCKYLVIVDEIFCFEINNICLVRYQIEMLLQELRFLPWMEHSTLILL